MIRLFTQNKGKTIACEDSLTASVIGVLQYLPSEMFWRILKNALLHDKLPYAVGDIKDIQFWPSWNSMGTSNKLRVEPDVFLRFEEIDIILEAKRYDVNQQSQDQLTNQITAYSNVYADDKKQLYYIQVGGLHSLNDEKNLENVIICKTDWSRLLNEVNFEYIRIKDNDFGMLSSSQRVLSDVISAFAFHQFYKISWLEKLNSPPIETVNLNSFFAYGKY